MNYSTPMPFAEGLIILMSLSAFMGVLTSLALTFFNRTQPHANRLLSLSLLSVSIFALVSALLINHHIFDFPHAFRLASPLQYLTAPCSYLYVRAVLKGETRFRRHDWWHFVPFLLHTVELMPFLLQPASYKIQYLRQLLVDLQGVIKLQEGVLPAYYHPVLKFTLGSSYVLWQGRLLWQYIRRGTNQYVKENQSLLQWLKIFTALNIVLYPPILLAMFLPVDPDHITIIALFVLMSHLLFSCTLLFFRPQVLYGISKTSAQTTPAESVPESTGPHEGTPDSLTPAAGKGEAVKGYLLSPEKRQEYRQLLENYLNQNQVFLKKGYSIKELSVQTTIPQHHLSTIINQEYQVNFNDFINRYRIAYVKEKMKQPEWRQLTLEGIALEAGFTNRTTFFRAFTRHTGSTPSEYLSQLSQ